MCAYTLYVCLMCIAGSVAGISEEREPRGEGDFSPQRESQVHTHTLTNLQVTLHTVNEYLFICMYVRCTTFHLHYCRSLVWNLLTTADCSESLYTETRRLIRWAEPVGVVLHTYHSLPMQFQCRKSVS